MNCKQGDLAVIVRSSSGNVGRIVVCLNIASTGELCRTFGSSMYSYAPIWRIDVAVHWRGSVSGCIEVPFITDKAIRPLRDSDGEDEMLRLVGRPVGTPEHA